ncbi:MAG: precorrin-8X methylmutase [Selenomonadaceae bacterium]|nr:precorrin-8X methylmutase [Selenomonadaceae bacterium]MBP3722447.1 precorrin-8X methylmutase [Selenomonadaceae bacterium]
MDIIKNPSEIEKKSMEIIRPYVENIFKNEDEIKVASRIIHAAGDVDYAKIIRIHNDAILSAKKAITNGKNVYTDVEMVRTGINKKRLSVYGGKVFCKIADENVADNAKKFGITRSIAAMRAFGEELNESVVAIGNAPTALFEVLRLIEEENISPAVIIGIPVGFVGAAESKAALMKNGKIPFITVEGTKGGSPIAVAAFNAILYQI